MRNGLSSTIGIIRYGRVPKTFPAFKIYVSGLDECHPIRLFFCKAIKVVIDPICLCPSKHQSDNLFSYCVGKFGLLCTVLCFIASICKEGLITRYNEFTKVTSAVNT